MIKGHRVGAWVKRLAWLVFCKRCGLIRLNNETTLRAFKRGCNADDND